VSSVVNIDKNLLLLEKNSFAEYFTGSLLSITWTTPATLVCITCPIIRYFLQFSDLSYGHRCYDTLSAVTVMLNYAGEAGDKASNGRRRSTLVSGVGRQPTAVN